MPIFGSHYPIIIEIGAGVGEFTRELATIFPDGIIYAFEEDDANYDLLGLNVCDLDNVWIIHTNGLRIDLESWRIRHGIPPIDVIIVNL